jgi:hypothetical protein
VSPHINFRPDGYLTEKIGAQDVAPRAKTQRDRILQSYADQHMGLTDDQAADAAGLLGSCYWKRCGELRAAGYIAPEYADGKPITRMGSAGSARIVCWITDEGTARLEEINV